MRINNLKDRILHRNLGKLANRDINIEYSGGENLPSHLVFLPPVRLPK